MARAAANADVFNAIADDCRRRILSTLARGEASVGELTHRLDLSQPQVSKHLRVLRDVEAVRCRVEGRHRLYQVNPDAIRQVHEWTRQFEALWNERFDRLDDLLHELQPPTGQPTGPTEPHDERPATP